MNWRMRGAACIAFTCIMRRAQAHRNYAAPAVRLCTRPPSSWTGRVELFDRAEVLRLVGLQPRDSVNVSAGRLGQLVARYSIA